MAGSTFTYPARDLLEAAVGEVTRKGVYLKTLSWRCLKVRTIWMALTIT